MLEVSSAYYVKLGPGGAWEDICLKDGTIRLAFYDVPHQAGIDGDAERIRQTYLGQGKQPQTATAFANQVLAFYEAGTDVLWITFAQGFLWWCVSEPQVEFLGHDPDVFPQGSRLRRALNGWTNRDINGNLLRDSELSGNLTKVAMHRGTICKVGAFDYLVRKISGDDIPEVAEAKTAYKNLVSSAQSLLTLLTWRDFETLVDLVFSASGWRRTGAVGGSQKTVDIEYLLPATGERVFCQVKSSTKQSELDDYVNRLEGRDEGRMFFVYHSGPPNLRSSHRRVTIIGRERLSEMVVDAGLFTWLLKTAS